MLNPYIKHGTFLVKFDDCIKPYKEIDFFKLGTKKFKNIKNDSKNFSYR
jgi:hypothetical protein